VILNQIALRNFCCYRGEQVFNLAPGRRGGRPLPIVLFGGINGGGKTTLLDAVQLVLYGMRAKCSKRSDKPYDAFLRESIHLGVDPGEGAEIQLSFRYASEGREHLYEVTRTWSEVRGKIRESVQVARDGDIDAWLSENWSQVVEELIPFGIAQLCFFDAEKIRFLAEDETSTQALASAIKSLLGLDLAERLVTDAAVLESRLAKRARRSAEGEEVDRLETELAAKQAEIERLVQENGTLENPRLMAQRRLAEVEERFAKIGGQHWEQRKTRQQKLSEFEHSLKENEQRLASLAATELPLALVVDLLADAAKQAQCEHDAAETNTIATLLAERDAELLKHLKRKRVEAKTIAIADDYLTRDRAARATSGEIAVRQNLAADDRRLLDHLLERGLTERRSEAAGLLERVERDRRALEDLQRALAATPEEDSVRAVAQALKDAAKELSAIEQQVSRLERQLDALRSQRTDLEDRLAKMRRKIVDEEIRGEEDARLAGLLIRTQSTMQEFLRRATLSKIDRLAALVTESFRFLLRKQSLVERVCIHPETFAISLYDNDGQAIAKQRLSEGEKQIFAISVLWGLSRAAGRPLPAIIDTPMARLDAKHRDQLVARYFPNASHQVIVLSTDTEIERQYFLDLQPHIARAYHLNYDEEQKRTAATEGYFWDAELTEALEEAPA
jgi:DNA sulfur modification protein DndD